jgi:GT2 family glycosyltransferase
MLPRSRSPCLSVIVPATDSPETLERVLPAIRAGLYRDEELIVVTRPSNSGPGRARNAGALQATGDVLVFVDSDIVIQPDALARLRAAFGADPELSAVFGSYDDGPTSPAIVSQFRNLLHHYVHQNSPGAAVTFWAGLGAVRRERFLEVGGFDASRYEVPSVEDIDLGMRIVAAGGRIELHPKVQGTHLKHWTLRSMARTDLTLRGIPWIEMMLERRTVLGTLNLSWRERASTALTLLAVAALPMRRRGVSPIALLAIAAINARFYLLLWQRMGPARALAGIALHVFHRLVGVAAVPAGVVSHGRSASKPSRRREQR